MDVKLPLHEDEVSNSLQRQSNLVNVHVNISLPVIRPAIIPKEVIEQLGMDYAELKAKGVFD